MKKFVLLTLSFALMLTVCSCIGIKKCDFCGEWKNDCKYYNSEYDCLCPTCYSVVRVLDLDFDFDFDYDDYDYDYDYDYSYSSNKCYECGKTIDEDSYYCDKCLGYGTCQDCGKSIDDDRLYCDKCLGYGTCQDCGKSIDDDELYCDYCLWN